MFSDLCPQCEKCRRIVSGKGSLFFLCEVSFVDARYPKYPRQPVTRCPQFVPLQASALAATEASTASTVSTVSTVSTTIKANSATLTGDHGEKD